jgi:hypothetical protein
MDENTKVVLLAAIPTLGSIFVAIVNRWAGSSDSIKPVVKDTTDEK